MHPACVAGQMLGAVKSLGGAGRVPSTPGGLRRLGSRFRVSVSVCVGTSFIADGRLNRLYGMQNVVEVIAEPFSNP